MTVKPQIRVATPADVVRERNRRFQDTQPGIGPVRSIPDRELVATLVAYGQPKHAAMEAIGNPQLRLAALRFWADVQDAGAGDQAARNRVDALRYQWSRMRQEEWISDDPRRGYGAEADPKVLL